MNAVLFRDLMFRMSWFSKSHAVEVEVPPQLSDQDHLVEIETQFRQAERVYNEACFASAGYNELHKARGLFAIGDKFYVGVNASIADPRRRELEGMREQARMRRSELLAERAVLLRNLGKIR